MMCLGLSSAAEIKAEAGGGGLIAEALPFPPARSPSGRDAQTAAYYQILSSSPGKGAGAPSWIKVFSGRPICELAHHQQGFRLFMSKYAQMMAHWLRRLGDPVRSPGKWNQSFQWKGY